MSKIKSSREDFIFDIINYTFLTIVLLCVLYPLYFIIIASVSDPTLVNNGKVFLLPKGINFDGYIKVFEYGMVWRGYANTIFYTIVGTFFNIMVTMMVAYPLSRKVFSGKKLLMIYLLITMYFNGGLIPTYLVVKSLGLYDNWMIMIILGMVSIFNVIIAKTFIQNSIPEELFEAATIDGCSHFQFFLQILFPLSKAIVAVLVLYYGMDHWNDFMRALIYLSNEQYFPLQIILKKILISSDMSSDLFNANIEDAVRRQNEAELMKYALIIVSTMPVMILYPFLQKYFVQGVMIGSVKG